MYSLSYDRCMYQWNHHHTPPVAYSLVGSSLPKHLCLPEALTQACTVSDQGLLLLDFHVLLWIMGEKGEGIPWETLGLWQEKSLGRLSLTAVRPVAAPVTWLPESYLRVP